MSHSVVELDKRYSDRSLTPTQAVEECLEAIEELDPTLGAWQEVYAEEARAAARSTHHVVQATKHGAA